MPPYFFLIFLYLLCINEQQCNSVKHDSIESEINYDSLRSLLEPLYDHDQGLRQVLIDSIGYRSLQNDHFTKIVLVDAENRNVLLPILEKYGWIPRSKIGVKASDAIFCVVQHSDLAIMDKYFPQLDSLAKIGEADITDAAMMQDRLLKGKRQKQKYGSQGTVNAAGIRVIWPVQEPDKVDSLRKIAGFETTVRENAQRLEAIYNPDEKIPD